MAEMNVAEIGNKNLKSMKNISTPTEKALKWSDAIYKRFNACAAKSATQYPQTKFFAVWVCETGSDRET